jgi:hypothetical protein
MKYTNNHNYMQLHLKHVYVNSDTVIIGVKLQLK